MATILGIANEAANILGHSAITQDNYDNDENKLAKGLSERYSAAKRWVLRSYPWKDALKIVKIDADTITEAAADALYSITLSGASSYTGDTFRLYQKTSSPSVYYQAPAGTWTRQYSPPADFVRLRLVADVYGDVIQADYKGKLILSDQETVYAVYTYDMAESDIEQELATVIAARLAWKTARFMGQQEDIPDIRAEYQEAHVLAKAWDAQQDSTRSLKTHDWLVQMVSGHDLENRDRWPQMN